jgi:benzil reductase ((S)-benzoin forming)
MMYRCLSTELSPHGILVGSVRPGVVDTPMQGEIRGYDGDPRHFPTHEMFQTLHQAGKLEQPETVAAYFHWLLTEISDDEFYAEEWDIRNSVDDERWKKFRNS